MLRNIALVICCVFYMTIVEGYDPYIECSTVEFPCGYDDFCLHSKYFCNGQKNCKNINEEYYCSKFDERYTSCPKYFVNCDKFKCIPDTWVCNGEHNCRDSSDEQHCEDLSFADFSAEKHQIVKWFLNRRSNNSLNKWGHQVSRTAVALYYADHQFFAAGNKTGQEIRYELAVQLLTKLKRREYLRIEQLTLYVQAMTVACLNPNDFYKHDLMSELRKRVDSSIYANPLAILVLCNSGAQMTTGDVERLDKIFNSQHRPFWTEIQVISIMALNCIYKLTDVPMDGQMLNSWVRSVMNLQLANGTVSNPRTTALVIQMLTGNSYNKGFNWQAAIRTLFDNPFNSSSNFLDKYYLIPVLSKTSPFYITNHHCKGFVYKDDLFGKEEGKMISLHFTVWNERGMNLGRSWQLKMPISSTLYDAMENVQTLDPSIAVRYNVVDGKPYVKSVATVADDPETGRYWFTYQKTVGSSEDPELLEKSPAEITVTDNQEYILWYRNEVWNSETYGSGDHVGN